MLIIYQETVLQQKGYSRFMTTGVIYVSAVLSIDILHF